MQVTVHAAKIMCLVTLDVPAVGYLQHVHVPYILRVMLQMTEK